MLERNIEVRLRDDLTLRGWRAGAGDPLLLLHGFTGSVEAWGPSLLRELSRTYDVVAVDLLGHGASDRSRDAGRYDMSEILQDLGELLDSCGIEAATWIGYSLGGRVALAGSLRMPERVSSLVLESASPGIDSPAARSDRVTADHALALDLETSGIEPFVDAWMARPLFASQLRLSAKVRQDARQRRLQGDPHAWAACLRGLGTGSQPSYWDRLSAVRCPTLLLTGGVDQKFCALGSDMARSIPGARHLEMAGAGHQVHLEATRRWISAVGSFLADEMAG